MIADYAHRLAADCPSGARAETLSAPGRFYLRRAASGSFPGARTVASHCPAVPAVSDYPITMNMAGIILTAAGLGFLGLGAQPPEPGGSDDLQRSYST